MWGENDSEEKYSEKAEISWWQKRNEEKLKVENDYLRREANDYENLQSKLNVSEKKCDKPWKPTQSQ